MKMIKAYKWMAVMVYLVGTVTSSAGAGQIVTPELRHWAQNAIQQEKQIGTITRSNTIAVLYFQNLSGQAQLDPYQKGLAVMLISDLSRLERFTVIERAELQALVEELGLGQTGLVDPSGAPEIGRLLQAENLIGGAFLQDMTNPLNIDANILEIGPSKTTGLERIAGDLASLLDLEKKLLHLIIAALKIDLTPQQEEALKIPLSRNPAALLELFKGIESADQGRYNEAAEHYSRALDADPDLKLAEQSLEELKALGLLGNASNKRRLLRNMREQTSFSTTLNPPLPLSRIPQPAGMGTHDSRIDQTPESETPVDTLPDTRTETTGRSQSDNDTQTSAR